MSGVLLISIVFGVIALLLILAGLFSGAEELAGVGVIILIPTIVFGFGLGCTVGTYKTSKHKIEPERIEIRKTDHMTIVILDDVDLYEFKDAKAYNMINDSTTFYLCQGFNSWGGNTYKRIEYLGQ